MYSFEDSCKAKTVGCINLKLLTVTLRECDGDYGIALDFAGECENICLKAGTQKEKA